MIKLLKVNNNYWVLTHKEKTYKIETVEKLFVYGMTFGLKFKEIEKAVLEFNRLDHNYAEFGVWKKLVITLKKGHEEAFN